MKRTGGTWNRDDRYVYFLPVVADEQNQGAARRHGHLLMAVNDLWTVKDEQRLQAALTDSKVFMDSGIFWLTNEHMRAHGISMDEALSLHPTEIDGFDKLYARYVELAERYGDLLWGYIELDQGGRERKIETRAGLEARGLAPIPVYHPLNDGTEYLEVLLSTYDRICFGNVVQAKPPVRRRLLHMMWEAHTRHPDVWIHVLGLTPDQNLLAMPSDSADSSSWANAVRWHNGHRDKCALASVSAFPRDDGYLRGEGSSFDMDRGWARAIFKAATLAHGVQCNWRVAAAERTALGFDPYELPA